MRRRRRRQPTAEWNEASACPHIGGYSVNYVVREEFALTVPATLDPSAAAPLLCAGITTFSPLRHWSVAAGDRVGVVGLGGLGHMAVKLAAAMGAEVVLLTTSRSKEADARRLGAHDVVFSDDKAQTARAPGLPELRARYGLRRA